MQISAVCQHFAEEPSRLLATLSAPPPCYHFNAVTSSTVIFFCAPCRRVRGVTWDQMAASQLSHRGKKNELAEGESAEEAYYFSMEAAKTLMNPDRGRSPTQSYMHTSAHTIHPARLIALPLLACTCTVMYTGGISRCLISIILVGGAESEHSTPAT